jgi:hypothetical protein
MYKRPKSWLLVLALALLVRLWAFFPVLVERGYSNGLYPVISRLQRLLLGWIPVSIGDMLYGAAFIYLVVKLVRGIRAIFRKKAGGAKAFWWISLQRIVFWCLWIYVSFNLLWGLNYNREGIARQLQLEMKPYSTAELETTLHQIIRRLDQTHAAALRDRQRFTRKSLLFDESLQCYQSAETNYPFLHYRTASVKPSIFSYLGDYLGFTGYYNPFSGEAQVNTTVPPFVQPFTTCHEMGHQLGYAKENEANFAGYLSAKSSADTGFLYSVYFDLYVYGMRDLYRRDSVVAKEVKKQVTPQVKKDLAELRAFYERYQNPLEPLITGLYGQYLRANQQPSGMQTYNEVMAFLIAYGKKYGWEAL